MPRNILPNHAHFHNFFPAPISGLSLGARLPNLKFVSLAILEQLAFNAQKFSPRFAAGKKHTCHFFLNINGLFTPKETSVHENGSAIRGLNKEYQRV